jgi:hypothetical protein
MRRMGDEYPTSTSEKSLDRFPEHMCTDLRVQCGKWIIHDDNSCIRINRTSNIDALLLTA